MGVAVPGRAETPREGGKADEQGEEAGGGPREEGTSLHLRHNEIWQIWATNLRVQYPVCF